MGKKFTALTLAAFLVAGVLSGCGETKKPAPSSDPVTLTIAGGWTDCRAIEAVGREFTAQYPNCTIVYEYIQDYYNSVAKRMSGESAVDLFFTTNIQAESELLPYALDLNSCENLDLSNTFKGLIDNFTYREEASDTKKLYALPLGAEMRGLYINKTLLSSLNIEIPTNQSELLNACAVLKEKGYIPFHGNPGDFAQMLLYPWVCDLIANADDYKTTYNRINTREAGLTSIFKEPFEFMYKLIENDYYDYKTAQSELNLFTETTDDDYARYFLNIIKKDDTFEKADDVGQIAFMPSTMSLKSVVDKTADDYHSKIEYCFVPAPVGKDGGFAYISPAHGIAANKSSDKTDWSVLFLDFLFTPKYNKIFAESFNVIPNTKEALSYITDSYDIPEDRISELGQVTFDYDFYKTVRTSLTDISKANNPKYMKTADDGSTSLYPLDYYINNLEESFKNQ